MVRQKCEPIKRIGGLQYGGSADQAGKSQQGHGCEPEQHDGAKDAADLPGPAALDGKQQCDESERNGKDVRIEEIRGQRQSFDCAQHRNGRSDDAVAIEKRDADQAERCDETQAFAQVHRVRSLAERHQGEHAPFPVIVRLHHKQEILNGDHEDQRPYDQRNDAEDIVGGGRESV